MSRSSWFCAWIDILFINQDININVRYSIYHRHILFIYKRRKKYRMLWLLQKYKESMGPVWRDTNGSIYKRNLCLKLLFICVYFHSFFLCAIFFFYKNKSLPPFCIYNIIEVRKYTLYNPRRMMYRVVLPKMLFGPFISTISILTPLFLYIAFCQIRVILSHYEIKCLSYFTRRSLVLQLYNLLYWNCVFYSFK